VYSFGFGQSGALGHDDFESVNVPKKIRALEQVQHPKSEVVTRADIKQVACGAYHTLALDR
jgi:alpha-tubulin suppressor-like RCC1 family protein